ncbi:MAG: helix-turn-helix transcriptional regulator [Magnetococcales bacterium]|nr:helix-turn-helix transcriptional regulator [Magnetococcales bacterium]MBF0322142.1 helix-turn-helix transcriptional regulator [Magnetococcales bacterium]
MVTNLVGTRIRAIRTMRKWTQQQLADLAGIPRATLATAERDDGNPSLAVVFRIATALGMPLDDLVEAAENLIQVYSSEQMPRVSSGDGVYRAVTVSPPNVFHFFQQAFHLQPDSTYDGKPHPPGSEEYLYILRGEVILDVAGECVCLRAGDSARFRGNVLHSYRNACQEEAWGVVTILDGVGKKNGVS